MPLQQIILMCMVNLWFELRYLFRQKYSCKTLTVMCVEAQAICIYVVYLCLRPCFSFSFFLLTHTHTPHTAFFGLKVSQLLLQPFSFSVLTPRQLTNQ